MTHIKRNLSRSTSCRNCPLKGLPVMGAPRHAPGDCAARCRRCRYGCWPLVAAPLPLVVGFSLLPLVPAAPLVPAPPVPAAPSVPLLVGALLAGPEPKGFFQPPQELHADSESTSRPARNTFRCVRFMINSSVVGVL
jgi:hypothetical protein